MNDDSYVFIERVFEQLVAARMDGQEQQYQSAPSGDLIGKLIGTYLEPMFGTAGELGGAGHESLMTYIGGALTHYAQLRERDIALADALGSCACWGMDDDCEVCAGQGSPGWRIPDECNFTEYVRPALATIARHRARTPRLA